MPTTLIAVLSLLVLVLPGFIVAELASSRRASRGGRTDWELILRALWYALVLHLVAAASGWTLFVLTPDFDRKQRRALWRRPLSSAKVERMPVAEPEAASAAPVNRIH